MLNKTEGSYLRPLSYKNTKEDTKKRLKGELLCGN